MRTGDKKIFKDKKKLATMLGLRRNGYSLTTLGNLYNVHYTSIEYLCDKYEVKPKSIVITIERLITNILPKNTPDPLATRWREEYGERVNQGHTYKEYLSLYQKNK